MVRTRNRSVGGTGYIGRVYWSVEDHDGYLINMHLPSPERMDRWNAARPRSDMVKDLAQVFVHECDHAFGELRHKDMVDSDDIDVSATAGLELRSEEPKRRPKITSEDRAREKMAKCAQMLKAHESKQRREQKLVAKWRRKVRYYEKRLAKAAGAASIPEPTSPVRDGGGRG